MTNEQKLLKYTKGLTVLFAEDHKELRENTRDALQNFFKQVDAVENGKIALEKYKKSPYDIVLTDIKMPCLNGIELIKSIYEINPHQDIIVLSMHDESNYLIQLINLGIFQFIKKPINYLELIEALLKISKKLYFNKQGKQRKLSITVSLGEDYFYNRENKTLIKDKNHISLTKFEILFLDLLTSKQGEIFSNEEIVDYYFEHQESLNAQNIRKLVSKLRKKLPNNSIESIYGVGYRTVI
jgi:DNA-binding response OmpR family regulator